MKNEERASKALWILITFIFVIIYGASVLGVSYFDVWFAKTHK